MYVCMYVCMVFCGLQIQAQYVCTFESRVWKRTAASMPVLPTPLKEEPPLGSAH